VKKAKGKEQVEKKREEVRRDSIEGQQERERFKGCWKRKRVEKIKGTPRNGRCMI